MNKNKSKKKKYTEEEIFALLGINIQEKTDNNKIETRQKNYTINNESKKNNNDKNKITKKEYNKNKNEKIDICERDDETLLIAKNKVKETNANEKDTDKNYVNIMKKGLPNKAYFIDKYLNNVGFIYNIKDFSLQDVKGDGNCGYRCISMQIYGEEEKYYIIRENIYKYLYINKNNYKNIPLELDGKIIKSEEYIDNIKNNKFWMGDLEISVIHKKYNAILFLLELNNNNELHLMQINGDIHNNNSILLTLCFINNNHYNIIYENVNNINNIYKQDNIILKDVIINDVINANMKENSSFNLNITYANDYRKNKYIDIIN